MLDINICMWYNKYKINKQKNLGGIKMTFKTNEVEIH